MMFFSSAGACSDQPPVHSARAVLLASTFHLSSRMAAGALTRATALRNCGPACAQSLPGSVAGIRGVLAPGEHVQRAALGVSHTQRIGDKLEHGQRRMGCYLPRSRSA